MLQTHCMFLSDMKKHKTKKQVSAKQLLEALLQSYTDTHDLIAIYNDDGSELITVNEAIKFVNGLKEESSPERDDLLENVLDELMP
jgi:hypothetical protein